MADSLIVVVGAADTGRAPIAAALLRRLAQQRGYRWRVESAGVLGHDGAEAESEARDTMVHMGLEIGEHRARSIDDGLAERATLMIAIDSGTARVARARYAGATSRTFSLGELAGRTRDIPDPFRMQIGAWLTYAREIEQMLEAALPRIVELAPADDDQAEAEQPNARTIERSNVEPSPERVAAVARIAQLLQVALQMPGVVDWAAARPRIEGNLAAIAAEPAAPGDLAAAYVGLLRAGLALLPAAPAPRQLSILQQAVERLSGPIDQTELNELSGQIATLPTLT